MINSEPINKSNNVIKVKKVFIEDVAELPNEKEKLPCPNCLQNNIENSLRYMDISLNEAIYKCEGKNCMFPFTNFIYKNFKEKKFYKYEEVTSTDLLSAIIMFKDFKIEPTCNYIEQNIEDEKLLENEQKLIENDFNLQNFNIDLLDSNIFEIDENEDDNINTLNDDEPFLLDFTFDDHLLSDNNLEGSQHSTITEIELNLIKNPVILPKTPPKHGYTKKETRKLQKCFERLNMSYTNTHKSIIPKSSLKKSDLLNNKKKKRKKLIKTAETTELTTTETNFNNIEISNTIKEEDISNDAMAFIDMPLDFMMNLSQITIKKEDEKAIIVPENFQMRNENVPSTTINQEPIKMEEEQQNNVSSTSTEQLSTTIVDSVPSDINLPVKEKSYLRKILDEMKENENKQLSIQKASVKKPKIPKVPKEPKVKKEKVAKIPKEPKTPKAPKIPKEPKTPKPPRIPKEPKTQKPPRIPKTPKAARIPKDKTKKSKEMKLEETVNLNGCEIVETNILENLCSQISDLNQQNSTDISSTDIRSTISPIIVHEDNDINKILEEIQRIPFIKPKIQFPNDDILKFNIDDDDAFKFKKPLQIRKYPAIIKRTTTNKKLKSEIDPKIIDEKVTKILMDYQTEVINSNKQLTEMNNVVSSDNDKTMNSDTNHLIEILKKRKINVRKIPIETKQINSCDDNKVTMNENFVCYSNEYSQINCNQTLKTLELTNSDSDKSSETWNMLEIMNSDSDLSSDNSININQKELVNNCTDIVTDNNNLNEIIEVNQNVQLSEIGEQIEVIEDNKYFKNLLQDNYQINSPINTSNQKPDNFIEVISNKNNSNNLIKDNQLIKVFQLNNINQQSPDELDRINKMNDLPAATATTDDSKLQEVLKLISEIPTKMPNLTQLENTKIIKNKNVKGKKINEQPKTITKRKSNSYYVKLADRIYRDGKLVTKSFKKVKVPLKIEPSIINNENLIDESKNVMENNKIEIKSTTENFIVNNLPQISNTATDLSSMDNSLTIKNLSHVKINDVSDVNEDIFYCSKNSNKGKRKLNETTEIIENFDHTTEVNCSNESLVKIKLKTSLIKKKRIKSVENQNNYKKCAPLNLQNFPIKIENNSEMIKLNENNLIDFENLIPLEVNKIPDFKEEIISDDQNSIEMSKDVSENLNHVSNISNDVTLTTQKCHVIVDDAYKITSEQTAKTINVNLKQNKVIAIKKTPKSNKKTIVKKINETLGQKLIKNKKIIICAKNNNNLCNDIKKKKSNISKKYNTRSKK